MNNTEQKLNCLIEQIQAERETTKTLEGLNFSESRKEQIIQNRLGEVRRKYGSEMCMDESAWLRRND